MGEAQGKICQLDQLLCSLPSLLFMMGPQLWQFPPIHTGCPLGEGITRMLCTPESPEATLLAGPNTKFFQYYLHEQEWAASAFPTCFQMPQAVNVPLKHERGWEMTVVTFLEPEQQLKGHRRTKNLPETGSANFVSVQNQERSETVDASCGAVPAQRTAATRFASDPSYGKLKSSQDG